MYVYGGCTEEGSALCSMYKYDIQEREWISSSIDQEARYHHSACSNGNIMYISGGRDDSNIFDDVFSVNLDTLCVEMLPPIPNARYGHVSYYNNGLHIFGGCDKQKDFNEGGWKLVGDRWEPLENSPLIHGCVHASVVYHEELGPIFYGGTTVHHKLSLKGLAEYQDDLFMIILQYLPARDLRSIIRTSKRWNVAKIASKNTLWEKIYNERKLLQRYSYVLESNKQTIIPENVENGYYIACNTLEKGLKQAIQQFRKEIADMPKSTIKSQLWGVPSVKEALSTFTDENSKFIASIVGDGGIGKTSLLLTYCDNKFPLGYYSYGLEYTMNYSNNITADMRDYHEEEYSRILNQVFIGTQIYLLAFSVVQPNSFENIFAKWMRMIRHHTPDAQVILVGTMIEQRTHTPTLEKLYARGQSFITYEEGEKLAKRLCCIAYLEVSSVRHQGVADVFEALWRCVHAKRVKKKNCKLQ